MTDPTPAYEPQVGVFTGSKKQRRRRAPGPSVHPVNRKPQPDEPEKPAGSPAKQGSTPPDHLRVVEAPNVETTNPVPVPADVASDKSTSPVSESASLPQPVSQPASDAEVPEVGVATAHAKAPAVAPSHTEAAGTPRVQSEAVQPEAADPVAARSAAKSVQDVAVQAAAAEPRSSQGFPPEGFAIDVAWVRPTGKVDRKDPRSNVIKGTTAKVPAPIMRRFNAARRSTTDTHTSLLMKALREHVRELDMLILKRRPEVWESADDFDLPLRTFAADADPKGSDDLRIRPTLVELDYVKTLVGSINTWLDQNWPGTRPTTQSEIFAVVLDANLPGGKSN